MGKQKHQHKPPAKSFTPSPAASPVGRPPALSLPAADKPAEAAAAVPTAKTFTPAELRRESQAMLDERRKIEEMRQNAEAGFLIERAAMLVGLEEQLERLRTDRNALTARLENDRVREHDKLAQELDLERRRRLTALGAELSAARDAQLAELAQEGKRIEGMQAEVLAARLEVRRAQARVDADTAMLATDRAGFEERVGRAAAATVVNLEAEIRELRIRLESAATLRDHYFEQLEAHRTLEQALGGRPASALLAELDQLKRQNEQLETEKRTAPSAAKLARAEELERERIAWQEERAELEAALVRNQAVLNRHQIATVELQQMRHLKEAFETRVNLQQGALDALKAEVEAFTQADENRTPFASLAELDQNALLLRERSTIAPLDAGQKLGDFVTDLRARMATSLRKSDVDPVLDYAERDLRCWLGGLAMSRLILLQGISGTGKTSLPRAFAAAIGADAVVVPVQAGWRDRQDLIGHYNAFHRKYYGTEFLKALYTAGTPAHHDRPFFIVLDEINLSRVEQFFADFLSALELRPDERVIGLMDTASKNAPKLLVEGCKLRIPENVWFVGTANHDETTTAFADKTIDRAHVMELPRRGASRQFDPVTIRNRDPISYRGLSALFDESRRRHAPEVERAVKWLRDEPIAESLASNFQVGWGNRLEDQAGRYVPVVLAAGGRVGEAMDHLLASRVLRKLIDRHDVRPEALEVFKDELVLSWKKLDTQAAPTKCLALLDGEIRAKKGTDE